MTFMELNLSSQAKEKNKKFTKHINTMASILQHQNNNSPQFHGNESKSNEYSKSKSTTNGNSSRSRSRFSNPRISFSRGICEVKGSIFLEGLTQTTLSFCRETTLHGMKYIVDDIEELGSTFSKYFSINHSNRIFCSTYQNFRNRQKRLRKLISLTIWSSAVIVGAVFGIML